MIEFIIIYTRNSSNSNNRYKFEEISSTLPTNLAVIKATVLYKTSVENYHATLTVSSRSIISKQMKAKCPGPKQSSVNVQCHQQQIWQYETNTR